MSARLKREAKIFCCVLAGLVGTFFAINIHFVVWMSFLPNGTLTFILASLLFGFPTPGGAPLSIHIFNTAVWCLWGAITYGVLIRLCFGRVRLVRLAALYFVGMVVICIGAVLAEDRVIDVSLLSIVFLLGYLAAGLLVVRDWPARAEPVVEAVSEIHRGGRHVQST